MKGFVCIVLLGSAFFFSCSKDESEKKIVTPEPVYNGFDYFLNTNEEWYFEIYTYGVPPEYIGYSRKTYTISRDTSIDTLGKVYAGKVLHEKHIGFLEDDTLKKAERHMDFVVFFDKEERILYRVGAVGEFENGLINFQSIEEDCLIDDYETVKIGENYFRKYVLKNGQELIEGISLAQAYCFLYPPFEYPIPVDHHILKARYTSDEYSYSWKKP